MGVTAKQLETALRSIGAYGGQGWPLSTLAADANEALKQAGITTRQGAAVFIAQCMVESAYFRTTREYGGSSARYAPYYGRGFIQVTWRENYAAFGAWCKARGLVSNSSYFVDVPDRLADSKWAWLGAVWYFRNHRHGLVALANAGENVKVGRAINRGTAYSAYAAYGESHRQQAYWALLNAGISAPGSGGSLSGSSTTFYTMPTGVRMSVAEVQKAVGVTADGKYGTGTRAAVKKLQAKLGVTADGKWGPATEAAYLKSKKKFTFKKPTIKKSSKVAVDGVLGPATIKALQKRLKVKVDGKLGPATARALQQWAGAKVDGDIGPATVKAVQRKLGVKMDGAWGPSTTKAMQKWLNS